MSSEYQKSFNKIGYLNAEIITRKAYCDRPFGTGRCECQICMRARIDLMRKVNKLMKREFYEGV